MRNGAACCGSVCSAHRRCSVYRRWASERWTSRACAVCSHCYVQSCRRSSKSEAAQGQGAHPSRLPAGHPPLVPRLGACHSIDTFATRLPRSVRRLTLRISFPASCSSCAVSSDRNEWCAPSSLASRAALSPRQGPVLSLTALMCPHAVCLRARSFFAVLRREDRYPLPGGPPLRFRQFMLLPRVRVAAWIAVPPGVRRGR